MTETRRAFIASSPSLVSDWASYDPLALVGLVFVSSWGSDDELFPELSDGDDILLLDPATNRLVWHFHATAVMREPYFYGPEGILHSLEGEAYGMIPEHLVDCWVGNADEGQLVTWVGELVQRLDIPMPEGFESGPEGVVACTDLPEDLRPVVPEHDPDQVLRRPVACVGAINTLDWDWASGFIPHDIRQAVLERDDRRCAICRRSSAEVDLHFDHRHVSMRGGVHNADNLEVRCSDHPLWSQVSILDGVTPDPECTLRQALTDVLGLPRKASLTSIIEAASFTDEQVADFLVYEAREHLGRGKKEFAEVLAASPELNNVDLIRAYARIPDRAVGASGSHESTGSAAEAPDVEASAYRALIRWNKLAPDDMEVEEDEIVDWMADNPESFALLELAVTSRDPYVRSTAAYWMALFFARTGNPEMVRYFEIAFVDGGHTGRRGKAALRLAKLPDTAPDQALGYLTAARATRTHEATVATILTAERLLEAGAPPDSVIQYVSFNEEDDDDWDSLYRDLRTEIRERWGL